MTEKISVLIPIFNRESYIIRAVDHILNQTYKDLEIIIYNDGSTDNTKQVIERLAKKDNRIICIHSEENNGIGYVRNVLLDACKTKYACWQDSDDISEINRIKEQVDELKYSEMIFTRWQWFYYNARRREWISKPSSTNMAFATLMFPVDKKIRFNPKLKLGGEDWDWIKRMQKKYSKTVELDNTLYYVRFHEDRIGRWKRKLRARIPKEILRTYSYKDLLKYYRENYK